MRKYDVLIIGGGPGGIACALTLKREASRRGIGVDEDILALEGECRFRDCAHTKTKGCAIEAAAEAGTVDKARYENFIRMRKEAASVERALLEKNRKRR